MTTLRQGGEGRIFFLAASGDGRRLYGLRAGETGGGDEIIAWDVDGGDGTLRELGRAPRAGGMRATRRSIRRAVSCWWPTTRAEPWPSDP